MSVIVVDCALGNIGSVLNMIRRNKGTARRSNSVAEIETASKLILPGVGAFDHGMRQLHEFGLVEAIRSRAAEGIPLLGICLGMHLLGRRSEEGELEGLSLFDIDFVRFSFDAAPPLPVPHVGWNQVTVVRPNPLINDNDEQRFYFTHSYHAVCANDEDVLATTHYGYDFVAAVSRGNLFGVQFHPEKSHRFGLALIKSFLDL